MDKAAVGLCKVKLGEVNVDKASVGSHKQIASGATSDLLSASASTCQSSHSEGTQSLDSLKTPRTFEALQMPNNKDTSDAAIKDQNQDVLFGQDNSSSCVSKDDGAIVMSSDYFDDANHKNTKSSAASTSNFWPEGSDIFLNGQSGGSGRFAEQFSVEGNSGEAVLETVGSSDRVDPSVMSVFRDELIGGTLSKGFPSESSVDRAESSSAKMTELHVRDRKLHEESCVSVKREIESNDDTFNSSLLITNARERPLQGHTVPDNNGSDELVDVRVCDICGDAGREAMLALCSKCSDGSEHIYCMRVKIDKVPEGDWVCEDCMLMQEPKRLKAIEAERSDSALNPSYLKDIIQGLPRTHSDVEHVGETKTSHSSKSPCISAKRPASDIEGKSVPKRRTLEKSNHSVISSHFGRVSSLKIMVKSSDGGSQVSPLGNKSAIEVMESTCPPSGHRSPKHASDIEFRPAPKRTSLRKSSELVKSPDSGGKSLLTWVSSLKIINKGKGAGFQASSFHSAKKDMEQESSPTGHRLPKPGPHFQPKSLCVYGGRKQLTRVSSLNIVDRGESARFQASSLRIQSAKKEAEQETSASGHRSSKPEPQFQPFKSSSVSGGKSQLTRVSSLKIRDKGKDAHCRVSSFCIQSAKKQMEQANPRPGYRSPKPEQQCQAGSPSKGKLINIAGSNMEVEIHEDVCPERTVKESADHKSNKRLGRKLCKSMSFTGVSSVSAAASNAHLSLASNAESLRYGSERKSTENRSAQMGLPVGFDATAGNHSGTKMVSEIISRPHSSGNDVKNIKGIPVNGNSDHTGLESLACDAQNCENQIEGECVQKAELGYPSREDDGHIVASNKVPPVDLHAMKNSPAPPAADVAPSGILAVPESECIWKGAFHLDDGEKLPKYCSNVQAHLSTCASSKVLELVPKFHPELLLKEVPRLDAWLVQFQKNCPTEQDIALYFFAEDLLSRARPYTMLLEGMIRDDLALEANFDGVQLFVFPSSVLPVRSQRWNGLFFLWGVFRVRKVDNCNPHSSSLNAATLNHVLCSPFTDRAVNRTCVSEAGSLFAAHTFDNCIKGPASVNSTVLQSSSSTESMDNSFEHEVSSVEKCLDSQGAEDLVSCKDDSTASRNHRIEEESFPDGILHSNNFKTGDGPDGYSNLKTCIFPFSWSEKDRMVSASKFLQEEKRRDIGSRSSFSIDSGPSGSSDGAGCAKSDEGQVEQFQDPSNGKGLNLDLCLRPMSDPGEYVDLDLVLGFPSTDKYKAKHFSKNRSSEHGNVSLFLSLGMPCSNG